MSLGASDRVKQSTVKIAPLITAVHTMRIIAGATDPIGCPGRRPPYDIPARPKDRHQSVDVLGLCRHRSTGQLGWNRA